MNSLKNILFLIIISTLLSSCAQIFYKNNLSKREIASIKEQQSWKSIIDKFGEPTYIHQFERQKLVFVYPHDYQKGNMFYCNNHKIFLKWSETHKDFIYYKDDNERISVPKQDDPQKRCDTWATRSNENQINTMSILNSINGSLQQMNQQNYGY